MVALGQRLPRAVAAGLDLAGARRQPGEEWCDPRPHLLRGTRAGMRRHCFARRGPERLVEVAVRAIGRQAPHPQGAMRGRQVVAQRVAVMRRAGVPDHDQRRGVDSAHLRQEGGTGRCGARPGWRQVLDRPGLQADRRGIAGLLPRRAQVASAKAGCPLRTHCPRRSPSARQWVASTKTIVTPHSPAAVSRVASPSTRRPVWPRRP